MLFGDDHIGTLLSSQNTITHHQQAPHCVAARFRGNFSNLIHPALGRQIQPATATTVTSEDLHLAHLAPDKSIKPKHPTHQLNHKPNSQCERLLPQRPVGLTP